MLLNTNYYLIIFYIWLNNNDNNSILTLSIAIIKMTLFLLFFSMVNREGSKTL